MRIAATLLAAALSFGAVHAIDVPAADLKAIAEKAKTLETGKSVTLTITKDGKPIEVTIKLTGDGVVVSGGQFTGTFAFSTFKDGTVAFSLKQQGDLKPAVFVITASGVTQTTVAALTATYGQPVSSIGSGVIAAAGGATGDGNQGQGGKKDEGKKDGGAQGGGVQGGGGNTPSIDLTNNTGVPGGNAGNALNQNNSNTTTDITDGSLSPTK